MRRLLPWALALLPAVFLAVNLGLPLVEDGLFWWVPAALVVAERGLAWAPAGALPRALDPNLPLPPQWAGGLPDYGHPPLWVTWLGLWLRWLGPRADVVRLATLPVVVLVGAGLVALGKRLGGRFSALPALILPTLWVATTRPDTDLPLLAASLWALVALWDRRPWRFAIASALAVASKEPGVLLLVPAAWVAVGDRRFRWAMWAPLLTLGLWAGVHWLDQGWALAGAEHRALGFGRQLRDLGEVAWIVLGDEGRWAVSAAGLVGLWVLLRRLDGRVGALLIWVAAQIAFFGVVNFLGGRDTAQSYTHVRYLLPAMVVFSGVAAAAVERLLGGGIRAGIGVLLLAGVPWFTARRPSPWGPEANLVGWDLARVWEEAPALVARTHPTLVESYLYTALTRPYAGLVSQDIPGIRPFGLDTDPDLVPAGARVLVASHGEPLGRLQERPLSLVEEVRVGGAWIAVVEVGPGRVASPGQNR